MLGGCLSLLGSAALALTAVANEHTSAGVWAAALLVFGSVGIWLVTLVQLHQRRLLAEEALEVAELERQRQEKLGGVQTIFDEEELDQMERLAMGRRLRSIERVFVPVFGLLVAAYYLAVGVAILPLSGWFSRVEWLAGLMRYFGQGGEIANPMVQAIVCGAIAFVCFLFSRWALGMSRLREWHLLAAAGGFSFGASFGCFLVAVGLLCAANGLRWAETLGGYLVGGLMVVVAVEAVLNFILDFYRPRVPGQVQRPFYESRLLGMFSEPEGILRSVAKAIDYQFGFKVSETWFYKLLGRAIPLLVLVQGGVILALTCITVVPPGHQAVIERWGKPRPETAKAGIHLTWFWPVDRATIIPVDRVQRMELGFEPPTPQELKELEGQPVLWTKAHYKREHKLLTADRAAAEKSKLPVNLLSLRMPVQWRVKHDDAEVIRYHSQSQDAAAMVESLAYRELTRYAARSDILDFLGSAGIGVVAALQRDIQRACDRAGYDGGSLGVEIVYVGIGCIHPPADEEVAKSYEEVVGAIEKRDAAIKQAEGDAARQKVEAGGTAWEEVFAAIAREDEARQRNDPALGERSAEVERLLRTTAGGRARAMTAEAGRKAVSRVFGEKSSAERYLQQMAAYEVSPSTYLLRSYLRVLVDSLREVQKYVVVTGQADKVLYQVDLKPPQGLDILGAELKALEGKEK